MKTDEIKVLDVLEQHAKENIDELAKKCGFSRQKLWRIIKQLEAEKRIWGYSGVTNAEEYGLKEFVLLVKRKTVPFDESFKKELIFDKLDYYCQDVKIENIYLTHGLYDGIVTFYAPNLLSAKKLIDQINSKIGKYFEQMLLLETLFMLRKQGMKNPHTKKLIELF